MNTTHTNKCKTFFCYRKKADPPRVPPMVLKKIGPNARLVPVPHINVPATIASASGTKSPLISVRQNLMSSTIDLTDEEETAKPRPQRNSLGNQPPALVALQGQQMKGKTLITAQPKAVAQQQAASRNAAQKFSKFLLFQNGLPVYSYMLQYRLSFLTYFVPSFLNI